MPTKQQLESALVNADKAGDMQAAKQLANALKSGAFESPQESTQPTPQAQPQPQQQGGWPRALGLTARAGIEGAGNVYDFVTSPIRAGMSAAGLRGEPGFIQSAADYLNLPKPESTQEKVISGAQGLLTGGGGLIGLASKGAKAAQAGGLLSNVAKSMAARPELQAASMLGAGSAGEYVKAKGAGPWEQLGVALLAGVAAPAALGGAQKGVQFTKSMIDSMRKSPDLNIKIDTVIDSALASKGIKAGDISNAVKKQLQEDMKKALDIGEVSPAAVNRLVDYRLTGTTPTAGPVTLDPGLITKQQNAMKMGAASQDPKLQALSKIANENEATLIENLNNLGAGTIDDQISAAEKVMQSLNNIAKTAKGKIDPLYKQARDTVGRSAHLDPRSFSQRANDLLDEKLLGGKLPADIRNKLNSIAKGETPLTVDVAEQLKTNMATIQRMSKDGSERLAISQVRQALEETPLLEGQGEAAIAAFNVARSANRDWMKIVEKTPALKAVMGGVEPDKFMNQFVLGSGKDANISKLASLKSAIKNDVGAQSVIKNNIARYIKEKALGGASDEVGRLSPSNYNKTLNAIGDRKLKMFFNPEEFNMLKAIGRVSSYEKAQPTGSAVNNSNTASTAISGILDWLGSVQLLRRVPGGSLIGNQAKGISQNITATQSLNVPAAISTAKQLPQRTGAGIAPFAAAAMSKQPSDNNR